MRTANRLGVLFLLLAAAGCTGDDDDDDEAELPSLLSLAPDGGIVGTTVTLTGEFFGDDQGAGSVTFDGVTVTPTSWSDSEITIAVPDAFPGTRLVIVNSEVGASSPQPFIVTMPLALYLNDDRIADNTIEMFTVSAGDLIPMAGSPIHQGIDGPIGAGTVRTLGIETRTRTLVTSARESLTFWDIDPVTGALTTAGSVVLTGNDYPYAVTFSPDGGRVYVTQYDDSPNATNASFVFGYSLSGGNVTAIPGSPFAAGLDGASGIATSVDGNYLYVNNEGAGELRSYLVGANGSLAELGASPLDTAAGFCFARNPDADRYYLGTLDGIHVYEPAVGGELAENLALVASMPTYSYFAFNGAGTRLFAVANTDELYVFDVDASGALVSVTNSPFTIAGAAALDSVHVSGDGTMLILKGGVTSSQIHLLGIDSSGAPLAAPGSPYTIEAGSRVTGAAFSF